MSILHCLPAEGNGELINDDNSATETIENVENMCLIIDKEGEYYYAIFKNKYTYK